MALTGIIKDFPILHQTDKNGNRLCYLDSAATSQKPESVIQSMDIYYRTINANIHRGIYHIAEEATAAHENARDKVRAFINAGSTREIIFTRNTTESINLVAYTWGRQMLKKGDVIILTEMEHHANLIPWQILAAEKEITLEFIPVKEDGQLDLSEYSRLLKLHPKLVSMSGMSNVIGTVPPIKQMAAEAHEAGALFLVDGAQMVPHIKVDIQDIDADFFAFSAHKMLGPTGIGVLYGKEKLLAAMPPFLGGGDMISKVYLRSFTTNDLPYKFEAGTPSIAEAIGFGAAIDYLNQIGMDEVSAHEIQLTEYAIQELQKVPGLKILGPLSGPRGSAVSFTLDYVHPHDVAQILDSENICVRAGHHCAMPLHDRFAVPATTRASFYIYNTPEDIDRLKAGLEKVYRFFG
ncbi:MAG: cysteine desulfurase [Flexilinea sp.]